MYVCALRPRGEPLSKADVFGYITRMKRDGAAMHSIVEGPFAAVALERPGQHRSLLGRYGGLIGAGDVRLDNRREIAELAGVAASEHSDLELVLAAIDRHGEGCIRRVLGDFAFVCWDARAQKLLAVRDAFGVKPLFARAAAGLQLFSSDVEPLRQDDAYDLDYMVDYLATGVQPGDATIWRDVSPVGAGSIVRHRGTVRSSEKYWRADEFLPAEHGSEKDNASEFRALLDEAVRQRVDDPSQTWAHLSGGLDSSSVVAVASEQCGGLAGTITVVDSLGEGDERLYSDALVQKYDLRNEQVRDFWAWQDDGEAAPTTDQPASLYPFYARDRRVWSTVRAAGGRVLLSGLGADHYLYGTLDYITDMAAAGHIRSAVSEVTTWSVATRQSFWSMGRRFLVDPFIMRARSSAPPRWMARAVAMPARGTYPAPHRFAARVSAMVSSIPSWIERWPFGGEVEMRYPFLYRPLVEHSLRLPVKHRVRPNEHKWILREATRDVLPEQVRTRSTKGGIDARILWSLQHERARLDRMLRDPLLGQLGCVDPAALRGAVDDARRGVAMNNVQLFSTLALETWLAVRSGAWSVAPARTYSAA